jgi:hypothetical protein
MDQTNEQSKKLRDIDRCINSLLGNCDCVSYCLEYDSNQKSNEADRAK